MAEKDQVLVTKEGLEKLKEELAYLKNIRRKEVAVRIKEAISYGDLSENSEYEDAKNEQAFIEGKISDLEAKIKNAKIIKDKATSGDIVNVGSTVVIKNLDENEKETYTIVGSTESDPLSGRISNESPIGKALLGQQIGAKLKITVPEGFVEYEILKIS